MPVDPGPFASTAAKFNRAQTHLRAYNAIRETKAHSIRMAVEVEAEGGNHFRWVLHEPIIENAQPCKGWDGPGRHPLLELHDLDITDKHRSFNAVLVLPIAAEFIVHETRGCRVVGTTPVATETRLEPGAVVAQLELAFTAPKGYIDVESVFASEIELESGGLAIENALGLISGYVNERLLAPLVPGLSAVVTD